MAGTGYSCFWLANFFKSSPLKPLSQMNRNLVGSIYGRSSIKIAHFVPIHLQTWPPQAILVSDWLMLTDDGRQVMAKAHIAFVKVSSKCIPIHMDPPFSTPLGLLFLLCISVKFWQMLFLTSCSYFYWSYSTHCAIVVSILFLTFYSYSLCGYFSLHPVIIISALLEYENESRKKSLINSCIYLKNKKIKCWITFLLCLLQKCEIIGFVFVLMPFSTISSQYDWLRSYQSVINSTS
jgi:hypothetical protein